MLIVEPKLPEFGSNGVHPNAIFLLSSRFIKKIALLAFSECFVVLFSLKLNISTKFAVQKKINYMKHPSASWRTLVYDYLS